MPSRLTRPTVGLSPTSPFFDAGDVIEPSVSVPTATAARLAAMAAALPELDPLALRSSAYGLRVRPPRALQPLDRARRAEVGPFAEVRLAQDHRAGVAQSRHEKGIARRGEVRERERSGARAHAVARRDVVLEQDRDAVQRAAEHARLALAVALGGDGKGIRIEFDDRADARSLAVDGADAGQVARRQGARGQPAGRHARLQLGDRCLQVLETRCGANGRCGHDGGRGGGAQQKVPPMHRYVKERVSRRST